MSLVLSDVRAFAPFLKPSSLFRLSTVEVSPAHSCQFRDVILLFLLFSLKLCVDLAWGFIARFPVNSGLLTRRGWRGSANFSSLPGIPQSSHQGTEVAVASLESQLAPPPPHVWASLALLSVSLSCSTVGGIKVVSPQKGPTQEGNPHLAHSRVGRPLPRMGWLIS